MNVAVLVGILALASLQGALVALPGASALGRLRSLRSPAWVLLPPGMILVGTALVAVMPETALGLVTLAALLTPLLAATSVLAVVRVPHALRGRRVALLPVTAAVTAFAVLAGGWVAELAAAVITAAGCLALGVGVVRLIPQRWVPVSMLATVAVDAALLALGPGHSAIGAMAIAQHQFQGPTFDGATIGPISIDYPDLVLAALLGGTAAEDPARQRRAALLLTALACLYGLLLAVIHVLPATVPIALTYFLLHRRRACREATPSAVRQRVARRRTTTATPRSNIHGMPMLRCPQCGIRQYVAAPYVSHPRCVACDVTLAAAKSLSVEARRSSLPRRDTSIHEQATSGAPR
jgi:hypothetical protein